MQKNLKITCSVLLGLLVLTFTGCVVTSEMFHGNTISSERVVAIPDTVPVIGSMQNFDVIINYELTRDGDVLKISGQAALTDRYSQVYAGLNHLYLYLFFVDDASLVLKTIPLARAMTVNLDERLSFSQQLALPADTVGLSFGYDCEVREGGGQNTNTYTFYMLPLKS